MARKQQEIPGTEPKRHDRLENCSEAYHHIVLDRLAMQVKEAEAKSELRGEIEKLVADGKLVLPEGSDDEPKVIYKYQGDEGEVAIRYGRKDVIKVGKAKNAGGPTVEA